MNWEEMFEKEEIKSPEMRKGYNEVFNAFGKHIAKISSGNIKLSVDKSNIKNNFSISISCAIIPSTKTVFMIYNQEEKKAKALLLYANNGVESWITLARDVDLFTLIKNVVDSDWFSFQLKVMAELNSRSEFEGMIYAEELYIYAPLNFPAIFSREEALKLNSSSTGDTITLTCSYKIQDHDLGPAYWAAYKERYRFVELNGYKINVTSINDSVEEKLIITGAIIGHE